MALDKSYIGISCTSHDPSVAIINNEGIIEYAQAAERDLQYKRAIYMQPVLEHFVQNIVPKNHKLVLASSWRMDKRNFKPIIDAFTKPWQLTQLDRQIFPFPSVEISILTNRLLAYCQFINHKPIVRSYDHHATHAAYACYSSPYKDAVCLVVDGGGEISSSAVYHYINGELKLVDGGKSVYENGGSLGFYYMDICRLCGFNGWLGEEWKVMGLAAYGEFKEELYQQIDQAISIDGLQIVNGTKMRNLHFSRENIAYNGQLVFEKKMFELINNLYKLGLSDNLIITGGCGLNSVCNGKISRQAKFQNVYTPSAPADDGNSVGTAWLAFKEDHPDWIPSPQFQSPYLGNSMNEETLNNFVSHGMKSRDLNLNDVVHQLNSGSIIGWIQGKAEFGPRALGNRSILADPRNPDIKQILNEQIKYRESFRPYAVSLLDQYGKDWFEAYVDSPYMDKTCTVRAEKRSIIPGLVHRDNSCRIQTVTATRNKLYYDLISRFNELTGVPMILNTSFNVMGKPIINTVEDAIATFLTTGIDVLVINNKMFSKKAH